MRFKRKLLGLLSVAGLAMGLLFGGLLTGSASAMPEIGPSNIGGNLPGNGSDLGDTQTANVPYLAWDGELVRLVWCSPNIHAGSFFETQTAHFRVHEWTGRNQDQQPQADGADASNGNDFFFIFGANTASSAAFFFPSNKPEGWGCVKADFKSDEAGLARISLNVYATDGNGNKVPEASTDFLAVWMDVNQPKLHEAAATDFPASAQANAAKFLGDPLGDGNFIAGGNPGLVQIKVTGSFPVDGDPVTAPYWEQAGAFPNGKVTLPNDWATLASIPGLATAEDNPTTNSPPFSNNGDPMLWDIHGTLGAPDTHAPQLATHPHCTTPFTPSSTLVDAVDNCNGASAGNTQTSDPENGPFSRVSGDLTNDNSGTAGIGPYDPERGPATLLSDGRLNADDAPMPAMQVNVTIAPNSGGATDISGVGTLGGADKDIVYSRDFTGAATPHNLYMPFYNAYIPATFPSRSSTHHVEEASGVDGPPQDHTGNFPGFLNASNPYDFWSPVATFAMNAETTTNCLLRNDTFRSGPSGPTSIALYTDERGEAYSTYSPGNGFFFNSLLNSGGAVTDSNGGCDLQALNGKPIGTSSISAKPVYPFEPVSQITTASVPITKTVISKFSKTLSVFPKSTSSTNPAVNDTRIYVAQAIDINGAPFAGEEVCFSVQSSQGSNPGVSVFDGTITTATPPLFVNGEATNPPTGTSGLTCEFTDSNGLAAIEVFNSVGGNDVIANFTEEKILRELPPTTTGTVNNVQPPVTNGQGQVTVLQALSTNGGPGTTAPSTSALSLAGVKVSPAANKGPKGHIATARLVLRHGKYFLVTRVNSRNRHARIRIAYLGRSGRTLRTFVRTVRSNRLVTVKVPYSARVASIHVTLAG